jgi:Flp pilus assembly secretin CpaC
MRRPIQTLALALAALCAAAAVAAAATPGGLTIGLNESRRIALYGSAATIIVDDPTVADVALTDLHSVIVIGRGYGVTQLRVIDKAGHALLQGQVTVVSPDNGRVTLQRGATYSEYACTGGRCHPVGPSVSVGAASSGGGDAPAPAPVGPAQPVSPST